MRQVFVRYADNGTLRFAIDAFKNAEGDILPWEDTDGPFEVEDEFGNNDELEYYVKKGNKLVKSEKMYKEYLARIEDEKCVLAREERNIRLSASDFSHAPDYPMPDKKRNEWRVYRQQLRDVTKQKGFPRDIDWPVEPK